MGYIGVNGEAKKIGEYYVGVDGVAKKVKFAYVGENGKAKRVFHEHGNFTSTVVVAANCTRTGRIKYTCGYCDYSYTEVTPKGSHVYIADLLNGGTKCKYCGEEGIGSEGFESM